MKQNKNKVVTGLPAREGKKNNIIRKVKRRIFSHVWLVRFLLLLGVVGILSAVFVVIFVIVSRNPLWKYKSLAKQFVLPSRLIDSTDSKTNILLLGRSGGDNDSPLLTDSIMVVSNDRKENALTLISLERDIWLEDLEAKLNSAYYWGEQERLGGGKVLAKSKVEDVLGIPIHYAVVIDFDSFKKIIDTLGGVEVEVENGFVDERYPVKGKENDECGGDVQYKCRYETVKFMPGPQFMDGETALKFVRSRNASSDEGTDIARAKRQQLVLSAIKKKIFSSEILTDTVKIDDIANVILDSIETDLDREQLAVVARNFFEAKDRINSYVVPEELLFNPPQSSKYLGLYVFIPAGDDPNTPKLEWDQLHEWVKGVTNNQPS